MKKELSICNVWLCLVVMFIHIISYTVPELKNNAIGITMLSLWSMSFFVVPGFIFLGGLKSCLKKEFSYTEFLGRRFIRVVIPYAVWLNIYMYFFLYLDTSKSYSDMAFPEFLFKITLGNITPHLYFVVAILQFYLLMPVWRLMINKVSVFIALPFSIIFMITAKQYLLWLIANKYPDYFDFIDRIFIVYIFYWVAGCYAGKHYIKFSHIIEKNFIPICVLYLLSTPLMLYFNYEKYMHDNNYAFLENIYVLYQTASIIFIYALSIKIAKTKACESFIFKSMDAMSYNIYLSHCLPLIVLHNIIKDMDFDIYFQFCIRFEFIYFIEISVWCIYYKIKLIIKENINKLSKGGVF